MSVERRPNDFQPQPERQGSPGLPITTHERAKPPPESQERQPLPNVWDVLERHVRLNAPDVANRPRGEEYWRQLREVNRSLDELEEKGTPRDGLTQELYNSIIIQPANSLPVPFDIRYLSLEQFRQFRSQVKPMSEEELREEVRKAKEERVRKIMTMPAPPGPPFPGMGMP